MGLITFILVYVLMCHFDNIRQEALIERHKEQDERRRIK